MCLALFLSVTDTVSLWVFIHSSPVVTGKKFGISDLGTDVINYISHATQQRLQNLLERASQVAQHKNITFKVIINYIKWSQSAFSLFSFLPCIFLSFLATSSFNAQEDARHEQVSDVRAQLKFFEQLDQMEKQRKEEQEREILLKAAKVGIHEKDLQYHWRDKFYLRIEDRRQASDLRSASLEYISSTAKDQYANYERANE